jgi:nicotinate dehydrogenase subunit A
MEIFKKHRRQGREDNMAQQKSLNVNGKTVRIIIDDPDMPLLYALRDNLALHGPRFGCGLAQCGACTVHIDGNAVRSCVTPLSSLTAQQKVVTLEGLGTPQRPHPVQRAFIEEQAVQCGYCINGMIMESAAFLAKSKKPTEAQVKDALANNLCRCGSHALSLSHFFGSVMLARADAATKRDITKSLSPGATLGHQRRRHEFQWPRDRQAHPLDTAQEPQHLLRVTAWRGDQGAVLLIEWKRGRTVGGGIMIRPHLDDLRRQSKQRETSPWLLRASRRYHALRGMSACHVASSNPGQTAWLGISDSNWRIRPQAI